MAKERVDQGGFLTLGGSPNGDDLFDGTVVAQATLTRSVTTIDLTGSGDAYRIEKPLRRAYELSGTAYLDGGSLFALGDTCYARYASQREVSGELAVLFSGEVVVVRVSDAQQQGNYETQEIAMASW